MRGCAATIKSFWTSLVFLQQLILVISVMKFASEEMQDFVPFVTRQQL
jgi:hypothetical protein